MRKPRSKYLYLTSKPSLECLDVISVEKSWDKSIKSKDSVQEIIQKARNEIINAFWEDVGGGVAQRSQETDADDSAGMNRNMEDPTCSEITEDEKMKQSTREEHTESGTLSDKPANEWKKLNNVEQYGCPICLKSFPRINDLNHHMMNHNNSNSINYKNVPFSPKSSERDSCSMNHLGGVNCNANSSRGSPPGERTYNQSSLTETHLVSRIEEKRYRYQCNACSKSFSRSASLRRHIKSHMSFLEAFNEGEATDFQDLECIDEDSLEVEDDFVCSMVSLKQRSSPLSECLNIHFNKFPYRTDSVEAGCSPSSPDMDWDSADAGNSTEYTTTYAQVKTNPSSLNDNLRTCQVCHKKCFSHGELKEHMKTHARQPYSHAISSKNLKLGFCPQVDGACSYCPKVFARKNELRGHLQIHKTQRSLVCSVCSKSFKTHSDLKKHFRTHSGEKPYMCPHCGKRFKQNSHLHVHLPTHTTEKRFVCSYCDKRFARNGTLKQHLKTHLDIKSWTHIQILAD